MSCLVSETGLFIGIFVLISSEGWRISSLWCDVRRMVTVTQSQGIFTYANLHLHDCVPVHCQ